MFLGKIKVVGLDSFKTPLNTFMIKLSNHKTWRLWGKSKTGLKLIVRSELCTITPAEYCQLRCLNLLPHSSWKCVNTVSRYTAHEKWSTDGHSGGGVLHNTKQVCEDDLDVLGNGNARTQQETFAHISFNKIKVSDKWAPAVYFFPSIRPTWFIFLTTERKASEDIVYLHFNRDFINLPFPTVWSLLSHSHLRAE